MILALDLSLTATGWCKMIDEDNYVTGTISHKAKDPARMELIVSDILCLANSFPVDTVAIEGFSYGSKGRGVFQIGGLGWIVRYELFKNKYKYVEITPSTLKKFVTGKGNAHKDVMMMKVFKRWGFEADNNNEADAFALAKYAMEEL